MLFKPRLNFLCLVRRVVVNDQMQIEMLGCGPVDLLQEPDEFFGASVSIAGSAAITAISASDVIPAIASLICASSEDISIGVTAFASIDAIWA